MISADISGNIDFYDATKDFEIIGTVKGHKSKINSLTLNLNENKLVSTSNDRTIKIWNLLTRLINKRAVFIYKWKNI